MSAKSTSLYVFTSITERWLEIAKSVSKEHEIFIFSPYITGDTIIQVFEASKTDSRYLITSLSADAYLSGSLDTKILRQLINAEVKIFHLQTLHAKVLLTGKHIALGSQNFTERGKLNVEASAAIELTKENKRLLEKRINKLVEEASYVDLAVLDIFEREAEKFRTNYDQLKTELLEVDASLEAHFSKGDVEKDEALKQVKITNSSFEQHYASIPVRVIEKEYETDWNYGSYFTLESSDYSEILNVFIKTEGGLFKLKNQMRYLCLELNSLRPYWIRANKKQIGKFATGVNFTSWQGPDGYSNVSVSLLDPNEEHDFANMRIKFKTEKYGMIKIGVLFSGQGFHLMSYENEAVDGPVEIIQDWEKVKPDYIAPILEGLSSKILRPFNYQNSRLGKSPLRLFTNQQKMELGLQKLGEEHFYVLR